MKSDTMILARAEDRIKKKIIHYPEGFGSARYPDEELREIAKMVTELIEESRYGKLSAKTAVELLIKSHKKYRQSGIKEFADKLLKNGHGGGNFRRLIIQISEDYGQRNT